jgi:hypothetical protein
MVVEIARTKIEERMNSTRENYRMMREELLKIDYWNEDSDFPRPRAQDRIAAAKNVVMMDLALLSAEIANGMDKQPIDVMVKEFRYDPLPDDVRTVVIAAWTRERVLPRAAIEQMIPESRLQLTEASSGKKCITRTVSAPSEQS